MPTEGPQDFFGFPLKVGDKVAIATESHMLSAKVVSVDNFSITVRCVGLGDLATLPANSAVKYVCSPDDLKLLRFTIGAEQ